MKKNLFMTNHAFVRRVTSLLMLIVFSVTTILMPAKASAQSVGIPGVNLPAVGTMLGLSESFQPAIIRGMTVYPDNPLKFDFIVNTGDNNLKGQALEKESQKLIKYFLASLTTPENEFWVNLSPYESGRIIPEALGTTEMGRDMLAQDYILKQLTASLLYPEKDLGNKFWQRVHEKAKKLYGVNEVPVDTFNKVWIMPDKAAVYENDNRVFVVERHLKVMLAEDYDAMQRNISPPLVGGARGGVDVEAKNSPLPNPPHGGGGNVVSKILKELIIPEIEKEVNEGENFAVVRQIYNSMILATWYKKRLKESLLGQVYVNQNKVKGIDLADRATKQKIYEQYLAAFKKGVYNYIKEDVDALTNEPLPRKYFSGGLTAGAVTENNLRVYDGSLEGQPKVVSAAVTQPLTNKGNDLVVTTEVVENASEGQVAAVNQTHFANGSHTRVTSSGIMEYPIAKSVIYFGRKGYKRSIPFLLKLLGHRDEKIRLEAEEILANLGATKPQMTKGYIAVYKNVWYNSSGPSRTWEAQAYAIQKSGELGDRQAIEPLLEQLKWNSWKPKANYTYAEQALEKLGVEKKQLVDTYVAALKIEQASSVYRREVIQKLGDLGDARAIESLLPFLAWEDHYYDAQVALKKLNATKDQIIAEYRRVATHDSYHNQQAQEYALTKLGQYDDVEFLINLLASDKISPSTREKVNRILSRLRISDRRIDVYKEVVELLKDFPSWIADRVYPPVYGIVLAGNKFSVVYEPEVLRATGEWRSMDYGTTESQVYKEPVYEVKEPEVLKVVNLNTGEVTDLSASSGIDNLKLTGAAGDLTVSDGKVSQLPDTSLRGQGETSGDASSSAITQWLDNSYLWNVWQLSPVFSVQRRLRAIGNLVQSGDPRARQSIDALLSDNNPEIKAGAAEALGQLNDQSVKDPLLLFLSDDSTQVRIAARAALDRLKTPDDQLVSGYIKALSASKEARLEAAKELAQLGRESDAAYKALKSLLKETDPSVVSIGIESLVTLGNRAIIATLLDMLNKENHPSILAALAFAMEEFKVSDAKQRLKELLRDDMDPTAFSQILQALEKLGDPVSDEFLIAKLRLQNSLSPIAIDHLGKRQSHQAKEALLEALRSSNSRTRIKARAALNNFEGLLDSRIELYDSVYQRLRTIVPREVNFNIFEEKVLQAYRITLAGDDFKAEYVQSMRTEYDWRGIYDTYSWPEDPNNREYQTLDPDSLTITRIPKITDSGAASAASAPVGGIDFNSAALDLQIKRDGNGVPLPLPQQTIQNMKIDGFYPVIINIAPVNIPMLLGQKTQKEPQQLSALR